jgi:TIR domain-containing protein
LADQLQTNAGGKVDEQSVKTRVFLSRKDGAFVGRLADALTARAYAPNYDLAALDPANIDSGISAQDEWWQRLQQMIAASDVIVFIVSPDSASSKVCDEEIAYSRSLGKRIIPILRRPIDFAKAPPRLSALNVRIHFIDDREEAFISALNQLCVELDVDVAWYRESRRLTDIALKWNIEGKSPDRLMSPADVRATDHLLERRPRNAEPPPQFLIDFLHATRTRAEEESHKRRRTIGCAFVKPIEQAIAENHLDRAVRFLATGATLADDRCTGAVARGRASHLQISFEMLIRMCKRDKGHIQP